jgi:TfoX/Sxy family transcriptional regulator of competence genes
MKTSEEFVEYVTDLLSDFDIKVKKLFSGVLLEIDGKQLGVIIDDILYFKITDKNLQEKYKAEGSEQFSYTRKDKSASAKSSDVAKKKQIVIKDWWSVPESALDSKDELVSLAEEVLDQ